MSQASGAVERSVPMVEAPVPDSVRPPPTLRDFVINGRFLTQPTTGVQRYAREVTRSLGQLLQPENEGVALLTPHHEAPDPDYRSVHVRRVGPGNGHLWEQFVLPFRSGLPILNLCNTAPVFGGAQVVCIHDANVFTQPESYSPAFRHFYRALQPWIVRKATRIATVSQDSAAQIARHLPISLTQVTILPNGYEHALRWNAGASKLLDRHKLTRPYILMLGSRAPHKNLGLVTSLAGALDLLDLDIVIAGEAGAIFAQTPAATAANIVWLGGVSDDDLALLMSRALCLAFPSLTEGFGLPVVEAMARGCPVVSSDRASLPEICGGAALMASPLDAGQWYGHFKRLLGSEGLQSELAARGREQARKFSWRSSAAGYLDLLSRGVTA
ncbi:glycosyl transferase [Kaistia sp. 32K]|uniref:glycosyltransferase family 4 protein n=1 Tax=Kaistia sp. 32K TaxID=2795690 RepID=UPI001914EEDB|nr:glycosyltransferase family 1 protein [Kaistia sp. 32K]BCP52433.1 glycosyl transferase [Kaistia sp. 32K]